MACLLISSASHCEGETIAARIAEALECRLIEWDELRATATRYGATEEQLRRALLDPPSLFGMSAPRRARSLAYLSAVLTEWLAERDVVYHGPCASFLVRKIPHVIRMTITGDPGKRAERMAAALGWTLPRAAKQLSAEDRDRRRRAELTFQASYEDPGLFDLVVDVDDGGVDGAVQEAVEAARSPRFQPSTYSNQCMENAMLAARIRAALVDRDHEVQVHADGGAVTVRPRVTRHTREQVASEIRDAVAAMPGVRTVEIDPMIDVDGRPGGL